MTCSVTRQAVWSLTTHHKRQPKKSMCKSHIHPQVNLDLSRPVNKPMNYRSGHLTQLAVLARYTCSQATWARTLLVTSVSCLLGPSSIRASTGLGSLIEPRSRTELARSLSADCLLLWAARGNYNLTWTGGWATSRLINLQEKWRYRLYISSLKTVSFFHFCFFFQCLSVLKKKL